MSDSTTTDDPGSDDHPAGADTDVRNTLPQRAGLSWFPDEDEQLVEGLRAGATVEELAARLQRTVGAITARLALMIPADAHVLSMDAAAWLWKQFQDGDYPWQEMLERRKRASRNGKAGRPAAAAKASAEDLARRGLASAAQAPDHIQSIWTEIVGKELSGSSRQKFLERQGLHDLRWYRDDVFRTAGEALLRRRGELRISNWATECGRASLGISLDSERPGWASVTAAHEVATQVRALLRAAFTAIPDRSRRKVLARRLGLDDAPPPTQKALAEELELSRERVRKLHERALDDLQLAHRPTHPNDQARQVLTALLADANAVGVSRASCLLTLSELALPATDTRTAVVTLARLAGDDRASALDLATQATALRQQPPEDNPDAARASIPAPDESE